MNNVGRTIVANGYISEAYNRLNRKDGEKYVEINMSDIYTALIQEAGRWCESYASDLLHDIDAVKRHLEFPDEWEKSRNFRKTKDGADSVYFRFGFRANGVDHREYIECALKNEHEKYHYYRSIWELSIVKSAVRRNMVVATLTRTA